MIRDAAQQCDIGETTVWRRMRDTTFVGELNRVRGELWNSALGKLNEASGKAVVRLAVLIDKAESGAATLLACKAVPELGRKLRDSIEFEHRLNLCETRVTDVRTEASVRLQSPEG